ncbi:oligosaccharide flippase family protein [Aliivibrio fischeri]|uniref:oligosaccharide flippase family protein n=1 Tax=Aliivibrio fischeri TaxID=668 RepID=UPI0007C58BE5|nr:oligosaccharide flippase family protein [Aliivibrio fischeri]
MLKKILKGGTVSLFRQVISVFISLYTYSLITNNIEPSVFGDVVLCILFVNILSLLITWSYNSYLIRYISKSLIEKYEVEYLYKYNYLVLFVSIVVVLFLLVFLLFGVNDAKIYLLMLIFLCVLWDGLLVSILCGYQKYIASDAMSIIQPFIFCLVIVLYSSSFGESEYLSFYLLSLFSSVLFKLFYVLFKIKGRIFKITKCNPIELYKSSTLILFSNLITMCVYRAHYFIISIFVGPHYLGLFALSQQIAEKAWMLPGAYSSVIYPILSNNKLDKQNHEIIGILKLMALVMLLTTASVLFIGFSPDNLFTFIFNERYLEAKEIILYMSLGIGFWSGVKIIASIFSALGLFENNFKVSMLSFIVSSLFVLISALIEPNAIGISISFGYFCGLIYSLKLIYSYLYGNEEKQ